MEEEELLLHYISHTVIYFHVNLFLYGLFINFELSKLNKMKNLIIFALALFGLTASAQSQEMLLANMETMTAHKTISSGGEVLFFESEKNITEAPLHMAQLIMDRFQEEPLVFNNESEVDGVTVIETVYVFAWTANSGTVFKLFIGQAEGYYDDITVVRYSNLKEL